MQPFTTLTGTAAPLRLAHVDTDMIIPKQYLKTLVRTGLGRHLFAEMRYDEAGRELPDFVLNRPAFRSAAVLLAGPNFGCGSSREHAPWALLDFGIRCVIAPSFADIFANNCVKNGLLPLPLPAEAIDALEADPGPLTVDLEAQEVRGAKVAVAFELDPARRAALLEGLDDIRLTERSLPAIEAFEARRELAQPWL